MLVTLPLGSRRHHFNLTFRSLEIGGCCVVVLGSRAWHSTDRGLAKAQSQCTDS